MAIGQVERNDVANAPQFYDPAAPRFHDVHDGTHYADASSVRPWVANRRNIGATFLLLALVWLAMARD